MLIHESHELLILVILNQTLVIQDFPTIEEEGWLGHVDVDSVVVQSYKLIPLGADNSSVC